MVVAGKIIYFWPWLPWLRPVRPTLAWAAVLRPQGLGDRRKGPTWTVGWTTYGTRGSIWPLEPTYVGLLGKIYG